MTAAFLYYHNKIHSVCIFTKKSLVQYLQGMCQHVTTGHPKNQVVCSLEFPFYNKFLKDLKTFVSHIWYAIRIWIPSPHIFQDTNWHNLSQLVFGYTSSSLTPQVVWVFPEPKVFQRLPVIPVVFVPP